MKTSAFAEVFLLALLTDSFKNKIPRRIWIQKNIITA